MKCYIDCVHCYLKQAATCMRMAEIDSDTQHKVMYGLMDDVKKFDSNNTPAENSTISLLLTYKAIGMADPYKSIKKESNDMAMKLYPRLKRIVQEAEDSLYEAFKISVAGNVIDLGINRSFDIEEALKHSLETGFSLNHYEKFVEKLKNVKDVLFLGDNAGEIVFDKLLVEQLLERGKKVTYVVKDGPILNDSTLEDAEYTGMTDICPVITNGSNYLGTAINKVSKDFLKQLLGSDLIISKGQANFESLEEEEWAKGKVFFILKIKCDQVGEVAGAAFGDVVFFTR